VSGDQENSKCLASFLFLKKRQKEQLLLYYSHPKNHYTMVQNHRRPGPGCKYLPALFLSRNTPVCRFQFWLARKKKVATPHHSHESRIVFDGKSEELSAWQTIRRPGPTHFPRSPTGWPRRPRSAAGLARVILVDRGRYLQPSQSKKLPTAHSLHAPGGAGNAPKTPDQSHHSHPSPDQNITEA
jgi:hypothetical protein